MVITEYEGLSCVKATCDQCGFVRWLDFPSTAQMLQLRCNCPNPPASPSTLANTKENPDG